MRSGLSSPSETPCKTYGNLYAKCVHRSGHRRHHPNLLTLTADRNSAEIIREKKHPLEYANTSSGSCLSGKCILLYGAEKFNKLNKTNVLFVLLMKQMVIFAFVIFNTQSDHCLENNTHNVTEAYK